MLTDPNFILGVSVGMFITVALYILFDAAFGAWDVREEDDDE